MTVIAAGGYEVLVGPLDAGLERLPDVGSMAIPVVTDDRVWRLHGDLLADRFDARPILLPRGEEAKRWPVLEQLLSRLAELGIDRATPIVTLGGGSVGDVGGLAASLFKRGCPIVHIPTTLLAQADSAIGGKTAIDFAGRKNLVGSFHQPALVLADPSLLATLDARQLRAGYAEVVKYGLIDDPAFFAWCEAHGPGLLAGHAAVVAEAIGHCVKAKARLVAGDIEDRGGKRALLNLGHSFAHAIEAEAGLGRVLHGEAVAIGLVLALRLSVKLGLCPAADAERVAAHLGSVGLPTRLAEVELSGAALHPHLIHDKKSMGGRTVLILTRGIGRAFVEPKVPGDALAAFLAAA